ncbi:hypothetical protein [Pseudarthrobacter cellobiosi]|uniref:hypothetical protein n=1 Tax=Pseudarthrobacter cellobiosi TaxID=2953654 RepID=UPI00208E82A1|nr:hypothetical protein [Pseudarthrobacter sp. HLT1-5]
MQFSERDGLASMPPAFNDAEESSDGAKCDPVLAKEKPPMSGAVLDHPNYLTLLSNLVHPACVLKYFR